MRVRVVGALLVVLAFVVTPLSTPGARAQTTRTKVAALVLQSQTPWVGRGGTFQVRIAAPPAVSDDPSDPAFAFSFAGTAFFIVGLHAASSRAARRFAWPTLVFNPHRQFDRLRESQRFSRFQHVIREAERNLQGSINPMLADFGDRSEASQYSGRRVAPDWKCPFSPHPPGPASESE